MDYPESHHSSGAVEGLVGHSPTAPPLSLPMAAWAVASAGDVLAVATGSSSLDAAARWSTAVGLVADGLAFATGARARRGHPESDAHPALIAAHVAGSVAVAGLFVASLALRHTADRDGRRPSALARSLGLAGTGLAVANLFLSRHLASTSTSTSS